MEKFKSLVNYCIRYNFYILSYTIYINKKASNQNDILKFHHNILYYMFDDFKYKYYD
jgi:hypothetical protein